MRTLFIETATKRATVALVENNTLLQKEDLPVGYHNSTCLMPSIQNILKRQGWAPADLEFITVGIGPGSYTGIRVGAVIAKTLSCALQIPLIGVSTLEGFVPPQETSFAAVLDAKISGLYLLPGNNYQGNPHYESLANVCTLEAAALTLTNYKILLTDEKIPLQKKLAAFTSHEWEWIEQTPDPLVMVAKAHHLHHNGENHSEKLPLLYLRKTQAEIERNINKNN